MNRSRAILIWIALTVVVAIPIIAATMSPQLAWRSPVYIAAGFAGIVAMSLLLIQPLLAGGSLPALPTPKGRRGKKCKLQYSSVLKDLVRGFAGHHEMFRT